MGPLIAILIGIPLVLLALGSLLFWIGWSLHSRHMDSERGAEQILVTFSKTLFQNQDTQGFWDRFGLATDKATRPGFLPRLFLYPSMLCFTLLSYYFRLLLFPFRLIGRIIKMPFNR